MMIIFSLKNGVNEIFSNHFMTLDVFGTVFGCFILKQVSSFFSWLPKKSQIKVCENFMNSVVIKLSHRNKRNWITVRKTFLTLSFFVSFADLYHDYWGGIVASSSSSSSYRLNISFIPNKSLFLTFSVGQLKTNSSSPKDLIIKRLYLFHFLSAFVFSDLVFKLYCVYICHWALMFHVFLRCSI